VFTARYALSPYIKQIRFVFKGLKGVLFRTGNVFGSVRVAHSVLLTETYGNLETLLSWTKYQKYNWQVCGDIKILSMLLGQQSGYTNYPCFTCKWESTARYRHWIQKDWPPRENLVVGSENISHLSLVAVGRDSSVGIPTRYGLDGPEIESRWGRDFPQPFRPALGSTQPPVQGVMGLFSRG
jgi:hypothetical protein